MIVAHSLLSNRISDIDVHDMVERLGYDRFVPMMFIRHLAAAFSYYIVTGQPKQCIQEKNEYTAQFGKFLDMINFKDVSTKNPIEFAIRVLLLFKTKVNFRKLESSALCGIKFELVEDKMVQNHIIDLTSFTPAQLCALNINENEIETIELSEEIKKLLMFYDGLDMLEPTKETNYEVVKQQIQSFSDFHKGRRYRLCLPTFHFDLVTKKLPITKVSDVDVLSSEVTIAIDYSLSMSRVPHSKELIKSVILYYIGQLERNPGLSVTVIKIVGRVMSSITYTDVESLKLFFKTDLEFVLPVGPTENIFYDLNRLYTGKSVVFLTDGIIGLKYPVPLKFKLYSIVLSYDDILKQMSLLSGGQFIILK
jgi:hypothetical protein